MGAASLSMHVFMKRSKCIRVLGVVAGDYRFTDHGMEMCEAAICSIVLSL